MEIKKQLDGARLTQARETAEALLEELELNPAPIMNSILKAKRLARLMMDEDAQTWLDLEARGYPKDFVYSRLGSCQNYARAGGRITEANTYYSNSLPQIEADLESSRLALDGLRFPANVSPSISSSNPVEMTGWSLSAAVEKVTSAYVVAVNNARALHSQNAHIFNGLKSSIHSYATDCHHALSLSNAAQGLFDRARESVDRFVRATAPKAGEQLAAAFERFEKGDKEALSHAMTSCRRLIQSVADGVFPAQADPYVDGKGKERKVGGDEYKNRILAFVDRSLQSGSSKAIAQAELDSTVSRVDALYDKACKGVHTDVTVEEVRLVLISTYLLLSEVVRLASIYRTGLPNAGTETLSDESTSTPPNKALTDLT
jgi:hypothetical protein